MAPSVVTTWNCNWAAAACFAMGLALLRIWYFADGQDKISFENIREAYVLLHSKTRNSQSF